MPVEAKKKSRRHVAKANDAEGRSETDLIAQKFEAEYERILLQWWDSIGSDMTALEHACATGNPSAVEAVVFRAPVEKAAEQPALFDMASSNDPLVSIKDKLGQLYLRIFRAVTQRPTNVMNPYNVQDFTPRVGSGTGGDAFVIVSARQFGEMQKHGMVLIADPAYRSLGGLRSPGGIAQAIHEAWFKDQVVSTQGLLSMENEYGTDLLNGPEPRGGVHILRMNRKQYTDAREGFTVWLNDVQYTDQPLTRGQVINLGRGEFANYARTHPHATQQSPEEIESNWHNYQQAFPEHAAVGGHGLMGAFNLQSPAAIDWAKKRAGGAVVEIEHGMKERIKRVVLMGQTEGVTPADMARRIKSWIPLTEQQMRAVDRYKWALRDMTGETAPMSSDSPDFDRFMREVRTDAMRRIRSQSLSPDVNMQTLGKPGGMNVIGGEAALLRRRRYVDGLVEKYTERLRKWRATNIARTETMFAANMGHRISWSDGLKSGKILPGTARKWIAGKGERTCDICRPMDGKMAIINENYWNGLAGPPAHPSCRCTEVLIQEDGVTAEALAPPPEALPRVNARLEVPVADSKPVSTKQFAQIRDAELQLFKAAHPELAKYCVDADDRGWAKMMVAQRLADRLKDMPLDELMSIRAGLYNKDINDPLYKLLHSPEGMIHPKRLNPNTGMYEDDPTKKVRMSLTRDTFGHLEVREFTSDDGLSYYAGHHWEKGNPGLDARAREMIISDVVHAWAQTSADYHKVSLCLQKAVEQEFNLKAVAATDHLAWARDDVRRYVARNLGPMQRVARAMYDETQALLAKYNIPGLYVYRGMGWNDGDEVPDAFLNAHEGSSVAARLQPASAFSVASETANSFASAPYRVVVQAWVPRDGILGTPMSGDGCLNESEVVVIGTGGNVRLFSTNLDVNSWGDDD